MAILPCLKKDKMCRLKKIKIELITMLNDGYNSIVGGHISLQNLKILLVISLVFTSYLVIVNPTFSSTLEPRYFDHLRHQRFSFEFLYIGFAIFNTEMGHLSEIGDPKYYGWPDISEPYPIGIVIFSLPFAFAAFKGIINPILINKMIILLYLVFAYVDIFLFARHLFVEKVYDFGIKLIVLLLFGTWVIFWSLNGQYDAIPILFILLTYEYYLKNNNLKCISFFIFAITFKYQALILSPLFIRPFIDIVKGFNVLFVRAHVRILILTGMLTLINIYTFYLSFPFISLVNQNPMYYKDIFVSNQTLLQFILLLVLTMIVFVDLYRKNEIPVTINILFVFISFSFISLLQMWYIIWIFPLILFLNNKNNGFIVALWIIGFIYILGWIPNYRYIFELISSIR